ncbi:MBL fold metallo-hydrolase [Candidatus Bathyarchaeota archaeon]|nr:MAG: MBL fold metallo-hydrolase [Candidatus Bathyarchaeota archaeon]
MFLMLCIFSHIQKQPHMRTAVSAIKHKIGDVGRIGSVELQVLQTPGHQHGGISLYDEENRVLFSSDSLTPTITFDTWRRYVVDA